MRPFRPTTPRSLFRSTCPGASIRISRTIVVFDMTSGFTLPKNERYCVSPGSNRLHFVHGGRWTLRNTCISSIDQYFILKVKED